MKNWLVPGLALGIGLLLANPASAQIQMGVAGPITGGSAAFGAQLKNGVEQAVEDINAAGGILGQKIAISIGDDRADPKEGVSVANKFVGDGVKFVIGHFNSGAPSRSCGMRSCSTSFPWSHSCSPCSFSPREG
jgi:branched-chain amino acid transport system substrate-binding protein